MWPNEFVLGWKRKQSYKDGVFADALESKNKSHKIQKDLIIFTLFKHEESFTTNNSPFELGGLIHEDFF